MCANFPRNPPKFDPLPTSANISKETDSKLELDPRFPYHFLQEIDEKCTQFEEKRLQFNDFTSHWSDLSLFTSLKDDLNRQFRLMKSAGNSRLGLKSSETLLENAVRSVKGTIKVAQELEALLSALQSSLANVVISAQERGRTLILKCSFCHAPNKAAMCSNCHTINWAQIFQITARSQTPERPVLSTFPSPSSSPLCPNCSAKLPDQSSYCPHCNAEMAVRLCSVCRSVEIQGPSGRCKECSRRSLTPTFVYKQKTVEVCQNCKKRDLKGKKNCDLCGFCLPEKKTR